MRKEIQFVPGERNIKYISDWLEYKLPKGHCIVDKGVTGCGYTEYCLTNNLPVVLCSPRKLLLENKLEQHLVRGDENIVYLRNEVEDISDISFLRNTIDTHIIKCKEENLTPKFLVTYDSAHYLIDILGKDRLGEFYFIVDEFQSIFLDSYFKATVENDFIESLQVCPNVLYLSATPMLDKYLEKLDEFRDLPFYKIDWSKTGIIETMVVQRKFADPLGTECMKIIKKYLSGKFPSTCDSDGKVVFSREAVFYFNSISDIIRILNKMNLKKDQFNIICSDTKENTSKLKRHGYSLGRIPLQGEPNKMFTFCTKTAYIGSDFYSDCASSYIFADPNIECLALDISLDLPQIVGRQRNRNNPFKNSVIIFYKTKRKSDRNLTLEEFTKEQERRKEATQKLLDLYKKATPEEQREYIKKLRDGIEVSKYENDFVSISKNTGKPVYNSLIEIANERSWEVAQVDYQDKISVTKALMQLTSNISEYQSDIEKEVQDFLDNKFYKTGIFEIKMKLYCEFMDKYKGNKEVSDMLYFKIKDPKYRKYYNFYGTSRCRSLEYREDQLESHMLNISKESELHSAIYHKFKIGDRLSKKEIKESLQCIYRDLGIVSTAKATDLKEYFKLTRTRITLQNKQVENGFRLDSL